MRLNQAIEIVSEIATRWGENAEEGFAKRLDADTSDEQCNDIATQSDVEVSEVIEVRDLWVALQMLDRLKDAL